MKRLGHDGRQAAVIVVALLRGPAAVKEEGKRERRARALHCPSHLGLGWSEGAARRWPAAAGGAAQGGGAGMQERGLVAVVGVVGWGAAQGGLFIGGIRRRRERGGVEASELGGRP